MTSVQPDPGAGYRCSVDSGYPGRIAIKQTVVCLMPVHLHFKDIAFKIRIDSAFVADISRHLMVPIASLTLFFCSHLLVIFISQPFCYQLAAQAYLSKV
jgi:hypothetical protein